MFATSAPTMCCGPGYPNGTCVQISQGSNLAFEVPLGQIIYNRTSGSTERNDTTSGPTSTTARTITVTASASDQSICSTASPVASSASLRCSSTSNDAAIGAGVGIPTARTITVTASASDQSICSTASPVASSASLRCSSTSNDAAIGAGVGIPLGVALIGALALLWRKRTHEQRLKKKVERWEEKYEALARTKGGDYTRSVHELDITQAQRQPHFELGGLQVAKGSNT